MVTVNVDVDNTLAKRGQIYEIVNQRYPDANLTPDSFTDWDFTVDGTGKSIGELMDEVLVEHPEYIGTMEPFEGAVELMQELHQCGVDVQIVTHRPQETHNLTRDWLEQYNIPYTRFVEDVPDNKADVNGDILIDDYHGNVHNMALSGGIGVLVLHRYNMTQIPDHECVVSAAPRLLEHGLIEVVENPELQWDALNEVVKEKVNEIQGMQNPPDHGQFESA